MRNRILPGTAQPDKSRGAPAAARRKVALTTLTCSPQAPPLPDRQKTGSPAGGAW